MSAGSRGTRLFAAIALCTALITGCSSAVPASTTPAASASPSPSPSASVDVAAAFVSRIGSTNSANTTLTGTIDLGPIRGQTIHGTLSGTIDFNGSDFQSTTTTEIAGIKQVSSEVKLGADKYKKSGSAPWFKETTPATGQAGGVGQFVKTVTSVQQAGTETVGGRELVVLRPPPTVKLNPADVGLTDPSIRNAQTDVEFLADPQGTPVLMRMNLSWTQAISGASVPVKALLEMAFDTLGSPVTIAKPVDVWKMHVSKRYAYQIAYPEGWEVSQESNGDSFLSPEGYNVFVFSDRSGAATLNQWTAGSIASWQRQIKARPQRNEGIKVGGQNARLLTYHAKIENLDSYFLDATVVAKGRGYDMQWTSAPGFEAAHRELFGRFLATVKFG
jgi:hypothetical protein